MGNGGRKGKKGRKNEAPIFSLSRPPAFLGTSKPQNLMKLFEVVVSFKIALANQKNGLKACT